MSKKSEAASLLGRLGGKARAERHNSETLSKWARRGGKARAGKYSSAQLRAFAVNAGRKPWKLTPEVKRRILEHLAKGWTHPRIASKFGVSLRTIGRVVARYDTKNLNDRRGSR